MRPANKRWQLSMILSNTGWASAIELLNETGIGPMGLGGDVTVLQCHVEHADTHMTLNPVAVNYQCWAARRASAHVSADGSVTYERDA